MLVFEWLGTPVGASVPAPKQIMLRDRLLGPTRMLSVSDGGVAAAHPGSSFTSGQQAQVNSTPAAGPPGVLRSAAWRAA